jgi:hypothetical protein
MASPVNPNFPALFTLSGAAKGSLQLMGRGSLAGRPLTAIVG